MLLLLLLLLLFWFDKDLKVLMPFGANTRTSCALFDALEVCGVSIDKQICTVFSYDAPLINLRTIRFFSLPCAESLFREYGIATIVKWKAPINERMVKQVHVIFETVSARERRRSNGKHNLHPYILHC